MVTQQPRIVANLLGRNLPVQPNHDPLRIHSRRCAAPDAHLLRGKVTAEALKCVVELHLDAPAAIALSRGYGRDWAKAFHRI
jgi:hypothetical protein